VHDLFCPPSMMGGLTESARDRPKTLATGEEIQPKGLPFFKRACDQIPEARIEDPRFDMLHFPQEVKGSASGYLRVRGMCLFVTGF